MELKTAAEVIGFTNRIEEESAKYYESLSQLHTGDSQLFLALAEENRKFIKQVERAYYGVISDALEGCFSFSVNAEEYALDTSLPSQEVIYQKTINKAIQMEKKIVQFYLLAAAQSRSFLTDVSRAMFAVAKKREERQSRLSAVLSGTWN